MKRESLLYRVLFLTSVGTLLPILILGGSSWRGREALRTSLIAERNVLAERTARQVADLLHLELEDLLGITISTLGEGGDERLRQAYQQTRIVSGVLLVGPDEKLRFAAPREESGNAALLSHLPEVKAALSSGRSGFTSLVPWISQQPRLLVLIPLHDWKGDSSGLVVALIDPKSHAFTSRIKGFRFGKTGLSELVDAKGTILVSPDPERVLTRIAPEAVPDGWAIRDGEIVSAAPVPGLPWRVVIRQDETELFAPVVRQARDSLLAIPALALISVILAWGAARSVRQPLFLLTQAAEGIAGGDLERAIPKLARDEVGRLGRSLERMRIALKESLDGIRSGNEVLERRVSERTAELQELTHELKARDETRLRLLRKVIAAQEDERKRIARELHDETCQTVTALAVRIETALSASTNAEARERLGDVGALARTTLDDLHRLIFDLRPSILDDLGLFPAIRWFAERNLTSKGISVRYEFDVPDDRLPPEYETSLFRAVQESLNNVVRHARAETVLLQAAIAADQLTIEIEDDGEGFDPDEVVIADESGRGLGILGIRERIELLRGTAVLESALGRGTHVTISVPLPKGGAYGQDHGSDS